MPRDIPRTAGCLAASLLFATGTSAQEIPREEYHRQIPLGLPRLVQQSPASVELSLWGDPADPGYRDTDPVDGIDDRRHQALMDLAVRFAPFLVQNSGDFPVNFATFMENRDVFPLFVDTWSTGGEESELLGTREVNFSRLGDPGCQGEPAGDFMGEAPTLDPATEDCRLLALMEEFSPGTGLSRSLDASLVVGTPDLQHVLFFNFPGEGKRNWKQAYQPEWEATPEERRPFFPHSFVHPFVVEAQDGAGYEMVLQYWFFYPNNDSGMDHEGDWEHLNVVLSPLSMVERAMPAETVRAILDGTIPATDDAPDPLVIKRVDFYFHESVWVMDYSSPNVYLPRAEWDALLDTLPQERFRRREIWEAARYMVYVDDAETQINTHPFGYIGGDNKGLNQALEMPGGSNRDPHGTYPFPGRYNNVGPGGTTDQVTSYVDSRKYLQDLRAGRETMGPSFRKETVLGLADARRLRIVPDWERLVDLAWADPAVRADWAWMLLPIRWGYPATQSPFSGVLEHFNTGNVAPQGPAYNGGWNVTGPGPAFSGFDPHTVPNILPLQVQDAFRNDLGFLNLTVPTLLNLPPLDFISRIASYPVRVFLGRRDPAYYPADGVPFRFLGISSGVSIQKFDEDFQALALNTRQYGQFIVDFAFHVALSPKSDTLETVVTGGGDYLNTAVGTFIQVPFYIGGRFTSENTVRNVRTSFGLDAEFNNIDPYSYSADLNLWEYAGSIRYSILTSSIQPFVKLGYGWSWYRVENARARVLGDEIDFDPRESRWYQPESIWPNTWHYGLGVEFIPWKRVAPLPDGLEIAIRLEYARYHQKLGLDLSTLSLDELKLLFPTLADVPGGERVHRDDFVIGFSVTF